MRKILFMLAVMSSLTGAQLASGQTKSTESPAPVASKPITDDTVHSTTTEAAPNAMADPMIAPQATPELQPAKKSKANKKDDTEKMQPDDPRKSPYWEPKDWTYIYNQGP
jgi:hypothetical protein